LARHADHPLYRAIGRLLVEFIASEAERAGQAA
jgi:hypothetical protein